MIFTIIILAIALIVLFINIMLLTNYSNKRLEEYRKQNELIASQQDELKDTTWYYQYTTFEKEND